MDASTLLDTLTRRGLTLTANGDRLKVQGDLTDRDRRTIRQHKPALLEALRRLPVALPPEVEGVPLEAIRQAAGEDWPWLAERPEALRQFVESAIWCGDLVPSSRAKLLEVLGRAAL